MAKKETSDKISKLAAKNLRHQDPDVRSLAASVLSQDETKGARMPKEGPTDESGGVEDEPELPQPDMTMYMEPQAETEDQPEAIQTIGMVHPTTQFIMDGDGRVTDVPEVNRSLPQPPAFYQGLWQGMWKR